MRPLGLSILLVLSIPSQLESSPDASTSVRESLLGENGRYFFIWVTSWINPGSYYVVTETLSLRKIDKRNGRVVESRRLRRTRFSRDPNTLTETITDEARAAFDLPRYLRLNRISLPFTEITRPQAELDSAGLFVRSLGGNWRRTVVPASVILKHTGVQGDRLTADWHLMGVEFTGALPDSGTEQMRYYRVGTVYAHSDVDAWELIIMVPVKDVFGER